MEPPVPSAAAPVRHDMPVPVCLSALYFMNLRGEIIMERQYRDDVTRTMAKAFQTEIINGKDRGNVPVVNLGACSFLYRRENNVYLVAVTRQNVNAMLCFTFLNEVVALFKSYFNKVSEKSLKNNFVVIYELLDEICDHGYPQITSAEVLKSYITQKSVRSKEKDGDASYAAMEKAKAVSMQVTGAVQWRAEGLKYKKNEVYLDVVENVSMTMSHTGTVLRASATGVIQMKCFLTGMPELKIGLNDKLEDVGGGQERTAGGGHGRARSKKDIELADLQFHQCVNLSKFTSEKTISFTPPDGEFELMKYRVTEGVSLPFKVMPAVKELCRTRVEYDVKIRSCFAESQQATVLRMRIPTPKHTAKATFKLSGGKAKYVAKNNELVWKLKKFQGRSEYTLHAEVEVRSIHWFPYDRVGVVNADP